MSKYKSSMCRGFGRENRSTVNFNKSSIGNPGPGSYRLPSEFGYYENRKASLSARGGRFNSQTGFRRASLVDKKL